MIKVRFTGHTNKIDEFLPDVKNWRPGSYIDLEINGRKFVFTKSHSIAGVTDIDFCEILEVKPKFTEGDHVTKIIGYAFSGEVKSVFKNKEGFYRVAVEHEDGWIHIFNESQLELVPEYKHPYWK